MCVCVVCEGVVCEGVCVCVEGILLKRGSSAGPSLCKNIPLAKPRNSPNVSGHTVPTHSPPIANSTTYSHGTPWCGS